jgi:serine/threonine protein phosphatase PrpC
MSSTGIEISDCAASPPPLPLQGNGLEDERDYAGRQIQGAREVQEDRYGVIPPAEFAGAPGSLLLVVADGMGGHAAGELASSLAVDTFAETFLISGTACDAGRLWDGLEEANRRIGREIEVRGAEVAGMGTTLLAVLLRGTLLRWMSVGDSPLYLVRGDMLQRLNRIHSKAEELAELVQLGKMSAEQARQDPTRHTLTSALIGSTLTDEEIAQLVAEQPSATAAALAELLLAAVESKQSPKQDNTTVVVVRMPSNH